MVLKIGLTGGIATGKSMVSDFFKQLGVTIIDADEIAHNLVKPNQPLLKTIVATFGNEIILTNGYLNRAKLRQLVFADPKLRQQLEAILHPAIKQTMQTQANQLTDCYCILSIPLLQETQQMDIVDRVLVVDCSLKSQKQRLQQRDNISKVEIEQILQAQANRNARLAIADEVIYNNSTLDDLQRQVLILHKQYQKKIDSA
ncbi:dephospho-CoA kinase [Candidatus Halobeggiatoa sp. HSG11]|nr:dephospho-CoA kinase [Candidatus Halobeggiatoa sp. HSG11]